LAGTTSPYFFKDKSNWAKERIQELLKGATASCIPDVATAAAGGALNSCLVEVTEVKDIEGEANIALVRGTRRYMYDFSLTVMWKATVANMLDMADMSGKPKVVKGSLKISDFSDSSPTAFKVRNDVPCGITDGFNLNGLLSSTFRRLLNAQFKKGRI
jgi:hypothetical protein